MKDNKNVKNFGEFNENLNISDVSDSTLQQVMDEFFSNYDKYITIDVSDPRVVIKKLIKHLQEKNLLKGEWDYNIPENNKKGNLGY